MMATGQRHATRRECAMTTKADYADDEWVRLRRAPFVAGMAISIADPGGQSS